MVMMGLFQVELLKGSFLICKKLKMMLVEMMEGNKQELIVKVFMSKIISLMGFFISGLLNCMMKIEVCMMLMEGFSCFGLALILCS
jgi:hypothetical protein